ncbi:MAG TPA: hypothetical protein VEY50_06155 [Lysobacter sp.]|nr:hypothetical protein [Lysobacter sp.]
MRRLVLAIALCAAIGIAQAQTAQCAALAAQAAAPQGSIPVAPELAMPAASAAGGGVLAQAYDDALSVDQVLLRLRLQGCANVASALPARPGAAPLGSGAAGYTPRTQYDNAPWRFDMSQGGKRMTADEFDAWMKARGVRVAKGAQPAVPPPPPPPEPDK